MASLDILKNPIILGVLAGTVAYLYYYWQESQRQKANPRLKKKSINIFVPGVAAVIVWFASSMYFDKTNNTAQEGGEGEGNLLPNNSIIHRLDENVEIGSDASYGSKSYRLVGKGRIQLPDQDVFLDLANF